MISLIISIIVFVGYLSFIYIKFGEQKSISDSVYRLPMHKSWIFIGMIYLLTIPMAILVSGQTTYLPFGILMISVVGSTFNLQSHILIKTLHYIGAIGGISMSLICLWLELGYWGAPIIMVAGGTPLIFMRNRLWKIEILAFLIIWITLLIDTV